MHYIRSRLRITITQIVLNMYLDSKKKQEIFKKHGKGESDTGSAEGQIALFTHRITHLTNHLKANKKEWRWPSLHPRKEE